GLKFLSSLFELEFLLLQFDTLFLELDPLLFQLRLLLADRGPWVALSTHDRRVGPQKGADDQQPVDRFRRRFHVNRTFSQKPPWGDCPSTVVSGLRIGWRSWQGAPASSL